MIRHQLVAAYDYKCPFAWRLHRALVDATRHSSSFSIDYRPFALRQILADRRGTNVWSDRAERALITGQLASVVVRDSWPDAFPAFHLAAFHAVHRDNLTIDAPDNLARILEGIGLPSRKILEEAAALPTVERHRALHTGLAGEWRVFGVPTLVFDGRAVFLRLAADPPHGGGSARWLERLLSLMTEWQNVHEFKSTSDPADLS